MDPAGSRRPAQAGFPTRTSVTIDEPAWRRFVPRAHAVASRALHAAGGASGGGASVVLSTDRAVQLLNARHRGRNKPTNVLTYDPPAPGLPGEIILALGTIRREAASAGRRPAHYLAHLVVHGALHLAGHDHHQAGEARRMEMAETRILHRLHVPNPWRRT